MVLVLLGGFIEISHGLTNLCVSGYKSSSNRPGKAVNDEEAKAARGKRSPL